MMIARPSLLLILSLTILAINGDGLTDFGGDVSQYMSLLQGSSAFSFSPGGQGGGDAIPPELDGDEELTMDRRGFGGMSSGAMEAASSGYGFQKKRGAMGADSDASALGDFGGDYGNYLKLLEGDSALGFNPQADPIGDNQVSLETCTVQEHMQGFVSDWRWCDWLKLTWSGFESIV